MITTQYQFNEEEFARPLKIHTWRAHRRKTLLVIAVSVIFILIGLFSQSPLTPLFLTFGLIYMALTIAGPWIAARRIRKAKFYNFTMIAEASEDEFKLSSDGLNSAQNWPLINHVYVAKEGALIYQNKRMFNWFPFSQAQPDSARDDLLHILERAEVVYTVE